MDKFSFLGAIHISMIESNDIKLKLEKVEMQSIIDDLDNRFTPIVEKRGDKFILPDAKNIFVDANGGGQDGQFTVKAERIADIGAPDIRVQGEKITVKASKDMTVIAKGQFELKYGFMVAAAFADENFGALTANLKRTQLSTVRSTPK